MSGIDFDFAARNTQRLGQHSDEFSIGRAVNTRRLAAAGCRVRLRRPIENSSLCWPRRCVFLAAKSKSIPDILPKLNA